MPRDAGTDAPVGGPGARPSRPSGSHISGRCLGEPSSDNGSPARLFHTSMFEHDERASLRGIRVMTYLEAERERRRQQAERAQAERDRAFDDLRVMTIPQWCEVNGFSIWTGKRLIAAGRGPKVTQI